MLTFAVLLMDLRSNIPTEPSARLQRKSVTLTLREGVILKEGWSDVRHDRFKSFTRMPPGEVAGLCKTRLSGNAAQGGVRSTTWGWRESLVWHITVLEFRACPDRR